MRWGAAGLRGGRRVRTFRPLQLAILVIPLLLSGLPLGILSLASPSVASPSSRLAVAGAAPLVLPNETLTVRNQTIGNLSNFWGVGVNPGYNLTNVSNETQGTPIDWVVWPAGDVADQYNMVNGTLWTNGVSAPILNDEAQFVTACRAISCHAIFTVPGEINDPSFGAYEVWYTEQVLNFHPAYWEIGNEPYKWEHFGQAWPQWNSTSTGPPSNVTYAEVVHAYIASMKLVDPTLRFIGLPGTGAGTHPDEPWINATVEINGPNLSAVAIHDYPGESGPTNATLFGFYQTLTKARTYMVTRIANDQRQLRTSEANISCTTCHIQFFVDEFGAGTRGGTWEPFMHTYAEVPYITAELLMMSESNVSNAEVFELRSGYNGSLFGPLGLPFPLDSLYSQVLGHYDIFPLNTSLAGTTGGIFAGVSESPSSNSMTLLAVNTNLTQSVELDVAGGVFPGDGTYAVWREGNSTSAPNGTVSQTFGYQSSASWVVPPLGVILVSACRSNASLGAGGLYPLTFCASGLPTGKPWSVTVGPTTLGTTGGTITFPEPDGNYSYQVGGVPGWSTTPRSGFVIVNGTPAAIQVPWTIYTYPVTFNESGLPAGTNWSVNLNGTVLRSATTNVTGFEPNGTFAYVLGLVPGFRPPRAQGSVVVSAAPVWVATNWTQVLYNVTFHESGLLGHTNWSVDLAGSTQYNASGGSIHFVDPNGTYPYSVGPVPGYTPDANSGAVAVRGYPKFIPLTWGMNASVFPIWFNETGLAPGTSWNVTLNGTPQSGPRPSFEFNETNGTYPYVLGGGAGWAPPSYLGNVPVAGTPVVVPINYTPVTYNVTFDETHLPNSTLVGGWSVLLNGTLYTSFTSTLTVLETNGTYAFDVQGLPGFTPSPTEGWATVDGNGTLRTVDWSVSVSPVTFVWSGLWAYGGETTWTVYVTGQLPQVNFEVHRTYEENLSNGTYAYSATTSIPWVDLLPPGGNFTVTGTPIVIQLNFSMVFAVTFEETGLPPSSNWSVELNGTPVIGNGTAISFIEPNGTYSFSVSGVNGLLPSPGRGSVLVQEANVTVILSFGKPTWPVTFTETGLPTGTQWSVALDGDLQSSFGATISFPEANGTHLFVIEPVPGWVPTPKNGSVPVAGYGASVSVVFTAFTFGVIFTELNLPAGTNWSVTLDGAPQTSPNATLSFQEPNGSYSFVVGTLAGWTAAPAAGTIIVDGSTVSVSIKWTFGSYPLTFTETGLAAGTNWSVVIEGGTPQVSNSTTITWQESPGNYSFQFGVVPGWTTSNFTGVVTVSPHGKDAVTVHWTLKAYSVTVTETGLPTGDSWSATLDGQTLNGTSGPLEFHEVNGSYSLTVGVPSGFTANPASETLQVRGNSLQIAVTVSAHRTSGPAPFSLSDEQLLALLAVAVIVPVSVLFWLRSRKVPPPPAVPPPVSS